MTHTLPVPVRPSLLGRLLRVLRTATLERMVLPDVEGKEIEEYILLESHLVRPPTSSVRPTKATFALTADNQVGEDLRKTIARKTP